LATAAEVQQFSETMHAKLLLRENIKALLRARKEDASTLARSLGHEKSWINKILNGHREMQVEDFDRVADFFGIATYQLFQPGISQLTERRLTQRRRGRERRIGHQARELRSLEAAIEPARPRAPHEDPLVAQICALDRPTIEAILQIAGLQRQVLTPPARPKKKEHAS
jgi:transcriptional regulator with XRE-family HTH domain